MFLDQLSVLVAIGFSGASLGLTFFMMWAIGRTETHLLIWSIGLAFIVAGVVVFGAVVETYNSGLLLTSFLLLIAGFGFLHAGCARFCTARPTGPRQPYLSLLLSSRHRQPSRWGTPVSER